VLTVSLPSCCALTVHAEDHCRFYAAEMLLGLADLHAKRVVYRSVELELIRCAARSEGDVQRARQDIEWAHGFH